jgi:hypothetical protein
MKGSTKAALVLLTPIFILLSHYLAVFAHEYAHSIVAWLLGYKQNPWNINYGGTKWFNILLLLNINENVDYDTIFSLGHGGHVALIAFAGPGIGNGVLYIVSLLLLMDKSIQQRPYLFYFLYWFNFTNLGNFFDYVPIRTFSPQGDIAHMAMGLNVSPWYIYVVIGYLVAYLIWVFFTKTLISAFNNLDIRSTFGKASLMMISVMIFFGYFGMAGFLDNGEISHFLSATSFFMIPGLIISCWPTRIWVEREMERS